MNKEVKVQNLAVQAKAEGGLLISEVAASTGEWDDVANTTAETGSALVSLYPTSTANGVTWYHATSKRANDAAAASSTGANALKARGYDTLTLASSEIQAASSGTNGKKDVFYVDDDGTTGYGADDSKYYVKYTYYLKASNESGLTLGTGANAQNVMISEVTATGNTGSADLDKALRVGIEMGSKFYIFAPFATTSTTYYVNGTTETTSIDSSASHNATTGKGNMSEVTALASLPGRADAGTPVYVYMWYEGEDVNCKSDFITSTLDQLTVNIEFKLDTLSSAGTDHGVSMSN